jgi:HPt (histidine-containing phosphotransfer) domain-containing protein
MSIEALSSINGMDTKQGLNNCMDDEDLYKSIIGMFVEQLISDIPKLTQEYEVENWIEIGKIAHSIKGASASVGAFEAQKAAAGIEHAVKNNNISTITENFQAFISLISSTSEALKQNL